VRSQEMLRRLAIISEGLAGPGLGLRLRAAGPKTAALARVGALATGSSAVCARRPITSLKVMHRYSMAVILVVPGLASAAADV
jgi:hypothetical protein